MVTFLQSQRFRQIGTAALAVQTDTSSAQSELERLEELLRDAVSSGPLLCVHPEVIDDYLWANWALHISWTALSNPECLYNITDREKARDTFLERPFPERPFPERPFPEQENTLLSI